MLKLAALAERLENSAHDEANALDRLEVRNRDRTADLAPVLADSAEASENELVRDVGEDVRDVNRRKRGLDRLRHRGVVARTVGIAECGEHVAQARHAEVVRGIEVNALELRFDSLVIHRGTHARGSGDGLRVLRRGGLEVDDARRFGAGGLHGLRLLGTEALQLGLLSRPAFLHGLRHDVLVALAGLNDGSNALALSVRSRLHGDLRLLSLDLLLGSSHDWLLSFLGCGADVRCGRAVSTERHD